MSDREGEQMTGPAGEAVDEEALIAAARRLGPVLRERQAETERNRRIATETIDMLHAAGLYRLLQPRRHGGLEGGLDSFVEVAAAIGAGCGSTGWVYATGAQHQWQIGMFPPAAQDDVWGDDRRALAASSYSPSGVAEICDGGWRLTGEWSFCSGVDICKWMILGVRIQDSAGDAQGQGYVLVPAADFTIVDTWHVVGLEGTGSKNVRIVNAFVPRHRMLHLAEAQSGAPPGAVVNPGALFRIPFFAAISICLFAAVIGIAEGALADYLEATRGRTTRGAALSAPVRMTEFQSVWLRAADAASRIDAARLLVQRDCRGIMECYGCGNTLSEATRARNKGDLGFATRLAVEAIDLLFESVGGRGIYNESRIQRSWRDIHAGARHISVNWDAVGSLYGRVLLGLPAGTAQF
jgi:resorcinol 4-hydroxylase (FADH2)